jgi:CBS domain containing-hemolysin-like protein
MSDPPPRSSDGSSLWQAVRDFLNLRGTGSLRETIEEAIEDHRDDPVGDPDDLDAAERLMLGNMLMLSGRKVGEIAVPRSAILAVDEAADFPAIVARFREAGHSRLPLYRESLDQVSGMLLVKDVYAVLADAFLSGDGPRPPAAVAMARPVLFVPPSMPVLDLLADMRRRRTHMAIVVDEFGGTDGLVTIEDIVEEIVGEIEDEHDEEEAPLLTPAAEGGWLADARTPLAEVERVLDAGFAVPDVADEVDTLGGLLFLMTGQVPAVGSIIQHPNGWAMEVVDADPRRIERVRLIPPPQDTPGAGV